MAKRTEPRPRSTHLTSSCRPEWKAIGVLPAPKLDTYRKTSSYFDVAQKRRSIRRQAPTDLEDVLALVREVFRVTVIDQDAGRRHKLPLSAGALHSVYPVLIPRGEGRAVAYDDEEDTFLELAIDDPRALSEFERELLTVLPNALGEILLLVALPSRVEERYENWESLIWRDAGCALQCLAMTATATEISFCPYGLLGHDGATAIFGMESEFLAVGAASIGLRQD